MTTKSLKGILFEVQGGKPGWSRNRVLIPSAGSGEVARYASFHEHEVYIADLNSADGAPSERVKKALYLFSEKSFQENPDFFMLTGMTCKADNNLRLAHYLRGNNENTPIIMGGVHVSSLRGALEMAEREKILDEGLDYALEKLTSSDVDYLYAGEAINISRLLSIISEGAREKNIKKIRGVSYKKGGKWFHNPRHLDSTLELPSEISLKESPMWDNYLFGFDNTHLWENGPTFPFRISKSCNYNCHFCSATVCNPDKDFRKHIPYTPLDFCHSLLEFENLLEKGAKFIFFTDENPMQKIKEINYGVKFFEELVKRGLTKNVKLGMMTSAHSTADKKIIDLFARANVIMAMVGYESLNNPRGIGKTGFNSKENIQSIRNLAEARIINMDGAIIGGFEDDYDSIKRELDARSELGLGQSLIQPLQPYFGTRTRIDAIKKGLIRNNGRENNGMGGFGGMHGEIPSLATEKGLEPLDVAEAIVSFKRKNWRRNALNVVKGPYTKHILFHLLKRGLESLFSVPTSIKEAKMSDRELAIKQIEEAIEYNTIKFS